MAQIQILIDRLGYEFKDASLLDEALSHSSLGACNYERLEFLGDSLLNFVIAAELFQTRGDQDEGNLSRMRASLVRQSTLAEIARELNLSEHLRMGVGELRSGGFNRDSILSDVVESIVGAVFTESGYEAARSLVLRLFGDRIANLPAAAQLKDPKTQLQELIQGRGFDLPVYKVIKTSGKDHDRQFTVSCVLRNPPLALKATASSRRKAEQAVAKLVLDKLRESSAAPEEAASNSPHE